MYTSFAIYTESLNSMHRTCTEDPQYRILQFLRSPPREGGLSIHLWRVLTLLVVLGVFEATIFPGCRYTLTTLHTPAQIASRILLFYFGGSVSSPRSLTGCAISRLLIAPLVVLHDPFQPYIFLLRYNFRQHSSPTRINNLLTTFETHSFPPPPPPNTTCS